MKTFFTLPLILCALLSHSSAANTIEVDDPILEGKKCTVNDDKDFQPYSRNFTSAYDQVFSPFNDARVIWACEESGYISLKSDFFNLNEKEKENLGRYLSLHKIKNSTLNDKLQSLHNLYKIRNTSPAFNIFLLRITARLHQDNGAIDLANFDRMKAYEMIKLELQSQLPIKLKMEYLFLAANYARQFGDVNTSNIYLTKLRSVAKTIGTHQLTEFEEQILELSDYTYKIAPGGVLEPSIPAGGKPINSKSE